MIDATPGTVEVFGGIFESPEGVFKSGLFGSNRLDGFDVGLPLLNGMGDVGRDVIGSQGGPADLKFFGAKWMGFAHGRNQIIDYAERTDYFLKKPRCFSEMGSLSFSITASMSSQT